MSSPREFLIKSYSFFGVSREPFTQSLYAPILRHVARTPPYSALQTRRAADQSAARLGSAVLGYLIAVTLIITIAPFRFATAPVHGLTSVWDVADIVMNVVMFVPIGFVYQLSRPAGAPVHWFRVLTIGACLSGSIEIAQLFEPTRYTSLIDVATNTAGAILGAWVYAVALRRIEGGNAIRTLALELPLMGLVYLLVPLMWLAGLASDGGARAWLMLPIVAFAGGVLGTVYAAYLEPSRRIARGWLVVAALAWYAIALLPGRIRDVGLLFAGAALIIAVSLLRSLATARDRDAGRIQRFELPTLRMVMPLFATYLALSSLWPLDDADGVWRSTWALLPNEDTTTVSIFLALEHVAAFTLVGYIIAEFHGRDLPRYRQLAGRILLWGGGIALLLEIARGFHPAYHASALMVAFTVAAATVGGWIYHLQRDHVRALLARKTHDAQSAVQATA